MLTLDQIIDAHPLVTDAAAIAALHNGQPTEWVKVPLATIDDYRVRQGLQAAFRDLAAGVGIPAGVPAEQASALSVGAADLLESIASPKLDNLDLSDETIRGRWLAGIGGMHAIGKLSAGQATYLSSLGRVDVSPVSTEQAADNLAARAAAKAAQAQAAASEALAPKLDRVRNAGTTVDPTDRAAVRAAILAEFDVAWPEVT